MQPDIFGTFSDEEWDKILGWLTRKNIAKCPICGEKNMMPNRVRVALQYTSPALQLTRVDKHEVAIEVYCLSCSYIMLFLAGPILYPEQM